MRKNKFLAALAIAACLATSVPFSVNAATPGQATDASKVKYGTVSTANQAVLKQLFDATYYKKNNPDLAAAGITTDDALFNHFVKCGVFEGRACCEGFNVSAYRCYPDLQAAFGDDIVAYYVHWKNFGQTEKRTLVTVEAAAAAGYTVKGVDGAVVSAPAAASTSTAAASTATSTEEKVAEDAKLAEYADGVDFDEVSGKFYDTTKGDESKIGTARGVLDGFVAVGGKYYATVEKKTAYGYDAEVYGKTKNAEGKDVYYDLTVVSDATATKVGIPDNWIEVKGKYYLIVDKEDAYKAVDLTKYMTRYDADNNLHYFEKNEADGAGYSIEPIKDKATVDTNGAFHKVVAAELTDANMGTYYKTLNAKYDDDGANIYALSPVVSKETATKLLDKYAKFGNGYIDKSVSDNSKTPVSNPTATGQWVRLSADGNVYEFYKAEDAERELNSKSYVQVGTKYYGIVIALTKITKSNVATYYDLESAYSRVGNAIVDANGITGEDAVKELVATKKASAPYVDFGSDDGKKNYPSSGLTGIYKEVGLEVARPFNSDDYAKSGDKYYKLDTVSTKDEVETYVPKDGYTLGSDSKFHKVVDEKVAYVLDSKNYGETKVNGKDVYYSKEEIDKSVATGAVKVAAEGYVLVGEMAYPIVAEKDAFKAVEGYKVTKNAEDGLYYYTK